MRVAVQIQSQLSHIVGRSWERRVEVPVAKLREAQHSRPTSQEVDIRDEVQKLIVTGESP